MFRFMTYLYFTSIKQREYYYNLLPNLRIEAL